MALVARHDVNAEEFFAMTWLPPTAQLLDGEVVVVNTPSWRHQHIAGELYLQLRLWIAGGPGRGMCGMPVDMRVDDRNVYAPDVFWFRDGHVPDLDVVRLPWLPDLAVEVLSPSTRRYDLGVKRERYEQSGVPELWLVDPRPGASAPARVLRRSEEKAPAFDLDVRLTVEDELASPQLGGFALPVRDLLA
jgi:Uma2 family endonuclease